VQRGRFPYSCVGSSKAPSSGGAPHTRCTSRITEKRKSLPGLCPTHSVRVIAVADIAAQWGALDRQRGVPRGPFCARPLPFGDPVVTVAMGAVINQKVTAEVIALVAFFRRLRHVCLGLELCEVV
jgi:hypothetical protein